jgi:hypothetical protein
MGGEMSILGDAAGMIGAENAEDKQYAASQQAMQQQQAALQQQREALALQGEMFKFGNKQLKPYRKFGKGANSTLSRLYGFDDGTADMSAFMESPDYQFRLQQGSDALQGQAAARGGLFSGSTGKALSDYNQNTASQEFGNYVNRLFGFQQAGQSAAGATANLGQNYANGYGNISNGMGNSYSNMSNIYSGIGTNQANAEMSKWNAVGSMADQGAAAIMGGMDPGAGGAGGSGGFDLGKAAMMFFGA